MAIPQSVREVVGRRLNGLSDECNRVLTIAAVIGREFDLRTLEHVTSLPGDTVLDLLEETVAARILDELPDAIGRYSLAHGLIRETLSEEITGKTSTDITALTPQHLYDLLGVPIGPRRMKCALLGLHTLKNAVLLAEGKTQQSWPEAMQTGL